MNHHTRITSLEDPSTLKTWSKKLTTKNDSSFSGLMSTSTITGIKSNGGNASTNAEPATSGRFAVHEVEPIRQSFALTTAVSLPASR